MMRVVKLTELIEALAELPDDVVERLVVEVEDSDGLSLVRFRGRRADRAAAVAALRHRLPGGPELLTA